MADIALNSGTSFADAAAHGVPSIMAVTDAKEALGAPPYPPERLAKIPLRPDSCCCLVADIPGGGVRIKTLGFDIPDEFELFLTARAPPRMALTG